MSDEVTELAKLSRHNAKLTEIMTAANAIIFSTENLLEYVDKVHQRITVWAYVDEYKAKSPLEFTTKTNFDKTIEKIEDKYDVNLVKDVSKTLNFITNSGNSFMVATAIALDEKESIASLFRVHPMPSFVDERQVWPITSIQYMAVAKHYDIFTPLSMEEAMSCETKGLCASISPSFEDKNNICAGTDYWPNLRYKSCEFEMTDSMEPYFLTIANRTFYSTPNTITVEIECSSDIYNAIGIDPFEELTGKGVLELPFTCQGHYEDLFFRPGERALKNPEIQHLPIDNVVNVKFLDKDSIMKVKSTKYKIKDMAPTSISTIIAWTTVCIASLAFSLTCCFFGIPRNIRGSFFRKAEKTKKKIKQAKDMVDRTAAWIENEREPWHSKKKDSKEMIDIDQCYMGGRLTKKNQEGISETMVGMDVAECTTAPMSKCKEIVPISKKMLTNIEIQVENENKPRKVTSKH